MIIREVKPDELLKSKKAVSLNINVFLEKNEKNEKVILKNRAVWTDGKLLFVNDYLTNEQYVVKKSSSKNYGYRTIEKLIPVYI